MRLPRVPLFAAVACAALAAGCQDPDVGARCDIQWGGSIAAPEPSTADGDYLETGNPTCDSLVCIVSPATSGEYSTCAGEHVQCGYCSKPCVSDADCYESETGLVCRQMVLDDEFIASLPPEVRDMYLGDAQSSYYCAVPLQ
jgi:hypothetical protein